MVVKPHTADGDASASEVVGIDSIPETLEYYTHFSEEIRSMMPTNSNNPGRTGQSGNSGAFVAQAHPQSEADGMANSASLGCFLVESGTGRLLATDAQAAAHFSVWPAAARRDITSADEVIATGLHHLFPELSEREWMALANPMDNQRTTLSTQVRRSDGSQLLAKVNCQPLSGNQQDYLLLSIEPFVAKPQAIVHRDALTGLPDRRELSDHHQRWQQTDGHQATSLAVLFMDLDEFKQVNDQYGHAVGDQVLATLAGRWQHCVRCGDIVVRYGGDEFVVLLAGVSRREEVEPVLARLTKAAADPIRVGDEQLTIGVTIGVALGENRSTNLEQLIHAADVDMYASKRIREP